MQGGHGYPQGQGQGFPQGQPGGYPQGGQQQGGFPQQGGQGYPQQGGYPQGGQQGGYPQQGGQQGGFPPQGHPQQGGYPQQGGQQYPPQGGQQYPPQGVQQHPQQGGYPPQGGQQGGYGGHQQGGYGGQQGYGGGPSQPIFGQEYCLPHEQVFFLSESMMSVSGDDFSIKDANNPAHFYDLKASAMSMSGSRVLKDANGKTVLNMKHKLMSGKLWYINRGANDKDVVAEVKKPAGAGGGRQTAEVFLKGNTSHHFSKPTPDFIAQGDVKGKSFVIYRGQQQIAEVNRKLAEESSKIKITGKDFYALKVYPGADAAFCISIVLVLDELYND